MQQVAGTIILNDEHQSKKFLVKRKDSECQFITTTVKEGQTGLAAILECLKQQLPLDIQKVGLIELSNALVNGKNLPIFVFESSEDNLAEKEYNDYAWETPSTLRNLLKEYDISGVPLFS